MSADPVLDKLAEYISVLSASSEGTSQANDRPVYAGHMAAAAAMFSEYYRNRSVTRLKELVAGQRRDYGWGYLSGDAGESAERAFDTFAEFVEQLAES